MWERSTAWLNRYSAKSHAGGLLVVALISFGLLWRLGNWTPGLSPAELAAVSSSQTLSTILNNSLYGPQKLLQWLTNSLGWHSAYGWRLPTALLSLFLATVFYLVLRNWFGKQAAVLGGLFWLSTPWLLVAARQATGAALYLCLVTILGAYLWYSHRPSSWWRWLTVGLAIVFCLYVPGSLWFLLLLTWFGRKQFSKNRATLKNQHLYLGVLLMLILISPLVVSFAKHPWLIKNWLLIPAAFGSALEVAKHLLWAFAGLFWQTADHFDLNVGRWPLLNVAQLVLCFFGAYAIWDKARKLLYGLLAVILMAVILSGINNDPTILLFSLPVFGLLMTAGLRYLYIEWRTIFPRNPIPQFAAIILISGLTITQLWFGWHYSLDVWPQTTATKSLYMLK